MTDLHHSLRALLLVLAVLGAGACDDDDVSIPRPVCDPVVRSIEPAAGSLGGGTTVVLGGVWLDAIWDVRDVTVLFGGAEAEVLSTGSSGCDACASCSLTALRCGECERVCDGTLPYVDDESGQVWEASRCESWVEVETPPGSAAGPVSIVVVNIHGAVVAGTYDYEPKSGGRPVP